MDIACAIRQRCFKRESQLPMWCYCSAQLHFQTALSSMERIYSSLPTPHSQGSYDFELVQAFEGGFDAAFDLVSLAAVLAGYQNLAGLSDNEVRPKVGPQGRADPNPYPDPELGYAIARFAQGVERLWGKLRSFCLVPGLGAELVARVRATAGPGLGRVILTQSVSLADVNLDAE